MPKFGHLPSSGTHVLSAKVEKKRKNQRRKKVRSARLSGLEFVQYFVELE